MNTFVIVALSFNPSHASHLIAYYKMFEELGYKSLFLFDKRYCEYVDSNMRFITSIKKVNTSEDIKYSLIYTPSINNPKVLKILKYKLKSKILYGFHEPLDSLKTFKESGFGYIYILKLIFTYFINKWIVKNSDSVLLYSKKALNQYIASGRYKNKSIMYSPLAFSDEMTYNYFKERKYISYIGTIAKDHSYDEFLEFVNFCISNGLLLNYGFQIATKSTVKYDELIKRNVDSGRLQIYHGKPMSNDEINLHYCESYVVWNAYSRTTQSGVLAKSFMFGTPVIIIKKNKSEFVEDGREVAIIEDNKNKNEIMIGVSNILNNFNSYSKNARMNFERNFYYKSQINIFFQFLNKVK